MQSSSEEYESENEEDNQNIFKLNIKTERQIWWEQIYSKYILKKNFAENASLANFQL